MMLGIFDFTDHIFVIHHFQGFTIVNDAASGIIWTENQISFGINETMIGK